MWSILSWYYCILDVFFNELWKFWTFGESLTLIGFINRYILGKGSQAVATLIGFFSFYLLMVFHITSAHFYCILSKNHNHSKCVQNIVFYARWQLNGNDLCKKPCQINTFQVSKSDINAEMQEMDNMGWVEFTLYIETIVIPTLFLYTPYLSIDLKYCILKDYTCVCFSIFMTVATSNVLVNEEYLLYDLNNIVYAVGGSTVFTWILLAG